MYRSSLKILRCPYCKSPLTVYRDYLSTKTKLVHAIVACRCDSFPVLDGVFFFSKDTVRKRILHFLAQYGKKIRAYTNIPIFLFGSFLGIKTPTGLIYFFSRFNVIHLLRFSTFIRILAFLHIFDNQWAIYLIKRFEERIFFPTAISTSFVKQNSTILDAGCGVGHLLYLLKDKSHTMGLYGVDCRLLNLYIAKRYFCRDANYMYCDLNHPLPFDNSLFDYIFVSDALHYVANQQSLANELLRINTSSGAIILSHLHNVLHFYNMGEYPNSPSGYISLFKPYEGHIYNEEQSQTGVLQYIPNTNRKRDAVDQKTFSIILTTPRCSNMFKNNIVADLNKLRDKINSWNGSGV